MSLLEVANLSFGYSSERLFQGVSFRLELGERAFVEDGQEFEGIGDEIADNGTGRWTVEESVDRAVPLPVITLSLQMRFRSRQEESYQGQWIAALRNQFGGHAITAAKKD